MESINECRYPIKYAAMPIVSQVGWIPGLNELEREYEVTAYIVSKCYLIKESTIYGSDGGKHVSYNVVFPFQRENAATFKRNYPDYNHFNGECHNQISVEKVFDSYEDAASLVQEKNQELFDKNVSFLPFDDNFIKKLNENKKDFANKMKNWKQLEEKIATETQDMKVGFPSCRNRIIINNEESTKISDISIYNYISIYFPNDFAIYHITQEEYDQISQKVSENTNIPMTEYKKFPIAISDSKNKVVRFSNYNDQSTIGNYYLTNQGFHFSEELPSLTNSQLNFKTKIFTTDSYEKLIEKYRNYYNPKEILNPSYQKKK